MKLSPIALVLSAGALIAASTLVTAQIERLDLSQMVAKTDNAVHGTITNKQVIRIDHPTDGPELYFTTLTVEGRSLKSGQTLTVEVTFAGGFIDDEQGVNNSEAPSADDVMKAQEDLVDVLGQFDPRIVKMAPSGERPED